jgi:hypothetical protein
MVQVADLSIHIMGLHLHLRYRCVLTDLLRVHLYSLVLNRYRLLVYWLLNMLAVLSVRLHHWLRANVFWH